MPIKSRDCYLIFQLDKVQESFLPKNYPYVDLYDPNLVISSSTLYKILFGPISVLGHQLTAFTAISGFFPVVKMQQLGFSMSKMKIKHLSSLILWIDASSLVSNPVRTSSGYPIGEENVLGHWCLNYLPPSWYQKRMKSCEKHVSFCQLVTAQ